MMVSTETRNLAAAIAGNSLFAGLDDIVLTSILQEMDWFSLPGGRTLFRQGDPASAMYLLTSGCLAIVMRQDNGQEAKVAQVHAGESVGEMALISGEPRSATVVAVRDSSLLRIDRDSFDKLIRRHPDAMFHLAKQLARRLVMMSRAADSSTTAKTIALVPADAGIPCREVAQGLSKCLAESGTRVFVLDNGAANRTAEWFHRIEQDHDLILYCAEPSASSWTRLCLRQADRILFLASAQAPALAEQPLEAISNSASQRPCDLVVLHETNEPDAWPQGPGWNAFPVERYCHLRRDNRNDLARLARLLNGRAVGIVLSSGGARGFAHLGVIRALREAGVPLDVVGGTSMGAVVGAGVALEWDDKEFGDRLRHAFVTSKPLNDYTVPVISLARGRKVTRLLREHFGEFSIEQLWRPCFCVSSNLTTATTNVHRTGLLWRALRASVALPGLLPPIVENGEVLVDGGVIDGFPVGTMRRWHQGPLVGVNVSTNRALDSVSERLETASPWWAMRQRHGRAPGIVSLLMRAATVSSEAQWKVYREQVDLLLEPPTEEVELLDWGAFDRAIELGYEYTMKRLETCETRLFQS